MILELKPGWYGSMLEENIKKLYAGDSSRIPWIFCVFAEKYIPAKKAAAKALHDILGALSFNDIIRIDGQMRQTTSIEWSINWRNFKLNDFYTKGMSYDERRAICIFASFNPNGYIRENAVQEMKIFDNTLSYIILRQNDWVAQVRCAASTAFTYRLSHLSDGEILSAMPFAEKLYRCSRDSHRDYTKQFLSLLTMPKYRRRLLAGLNSADVKTRKICIKALFNACPPKTALAFKCLQSEPDPFLRATIFRNLCNYGKKMDNIIDVFLNDKYPANRALALQYIIDNNANNIIEIAETMLADKNTSVRKVAQSIIKERIPEYGFREFYLRNLECLTSPSICGLGEKGLPGDADLIVPYLKDDRITVVKSAMAALMLLNNGKYHQKITEMLLDDRPGVVKTARNLIMKNGQPDYGRIKEIFTKAKYEHSKLKCMSILFAAPKWQSIIFMLECMHDKEAHIKLNALDAIDRWLLHFNHSFSMPSDAQVDNFRKLISGLNGALPHSIQKELLFVLPK